MEECSKILEKHGIDIHSAENGAAMVKNNHRSAHTKSYYEGVNDALRAANHDPSAQQQVRDVFADLLKNLE